MHALQRMQSEGQCGRFAGGNAVPPALHTAQVFLLLSSARLITALITAKQLSAFPGQIIKRNKRNPHALSL